MFPFRYCRTALAALLMLGVAGSSGCAGVDASAVPAAFTGTGPSTSPRTDSPPVEDLQWPRTDAFGGYTFVVHLPVFDAWKKNRLEAHAAVVLTDNRAVMSPRDARGVPREVPSAVQKEVLGVITLSARSTVDEAERVVRLDSFKIESADFPSQPGAGPHYKSVLQQGITGLVKPLMEVSLDRLEGKVAVDGLRAASATKLVSPPPRIFVSEVPAVLVPIAGQPVVRLIDGTALERVINTRSLLVRNASGQFWLHVHDGWMTAPTLAGPWTVVDEPSAELVTAQQRAVAAGHVDLMTGATAASRGAEPAALAKRAPAVYVAQEPAALIVFDGPPAYRDVPDTELMSVENTQADVFVHVPHNLQYVLLAGRWFAAASLGGPFTFVPSSKLPKDFRDIPDDHPHARAKAAVPGTAQARDALIANIIPRMAEVEIAKTHLPAPVFDGAPKIAPIDGTDLHTVENSATPLIQTAPGSWYAVENGVWFVGQSVSGPFSVAREVPEAVYTIPPSSPLFYLTFSAVSGEEPGGVHIATLPGYLGAYAGMDNVVYGTGHAYEPWVGAQWIPAPSTYEDGATLVYTNAGTWWVSCTTVDRPFWGPWYSTDVLAPLGGADNVR